MEDWPSFDLPSIVRANGELEVRSSMRESLVLLGQLSPVWIGFLLFPVGLVIGSFSSVLLHRLPRGESVVLPGSRCPACAHDLGPADLVPLLSFLWHQGRCRHCAGLIPLRYPALELGCGLAASAAGVAAGWLAGLAALLLWVGAALSWAHIRGDHAKTGSTLVEILIAVALLVSVAVPMLDLGAQMRGATPFQRQIAVSLAATKIEDLGNQAYRTPGWPPSWSDEVDVGRYSFQRQWTVGGYSPSDDHGFPSETSQLKQAVVTVTCSDCTRPMTPVRMVAVLAKL